MTDKITLDGGKYTVILKPDSCLKALRYGEPWREDDLIGDNLIYAMFHRILELEAIQSIECAIKYLEDINNG